MLECAYQAIQLKLFIFLTKEKVSFHETAINIKAPPVFDDVERPHLVFTPYNFCVVAHFNL